MKITRRELGALAAAAALATAAGPARAASKGKVVYLIPTLLDEFQTESQKAIEAVFKSIGYDVTSIDAQNDATKQLAQLEDALITQPQLIIVNAVAFDSIVPGIEKARAAGVKVMIFDRLIKSTVADFTSVAGTVEIGRLAGGEAIKLLKERKGSASGKILQILGDPGDSYTLDIQQGFEEVMAKEAPDVQIVSKAAMLWEATNAGKIFEDQLLVNTDIDLVFCHAAHLTVPIVATMEAKGMKPGQMMLMASNGAPVGLDNIRAGWQQAEIEQPTYAQTYGLAMFADMIIAGNKPKPGTYKVLGLESILTDEAWGPNLRIPGAVITKENVDEPRFWGNLKFPNTPVDIVT